jgi:hypothetical protein
MTCTTADPEPRARPTRRLVVRTTAGPEMPRGRALEPSPAPCRVWVCLGLLLLAGLLSFCHGCHADSDDELGVLPWRGPAEAGQ